MKTENWPPPEEADGEVAALIATLHETEQRLEELTGGEVDTVSDRHGRPYLLRRAQEELRDREADKQAAILNALPAHIALLDAQGVIISVNETWRRFATANFLHGPAFGVGLNYLDVCARTAGDEESDAHRTAEGIRAVLAGAKSFSIEYPCHSPTEQRWFLMTVTPLNGGQARGVVVMHLDITERRRAEDARRASQKRLRDLIDGLGPSMMVGLMTPEGILVEANAPALAAVGLKPEDVLGQPLVDSRWFAYSAEVQQQLRDAIARGVRGEASRYDMKIRGAGGELIDIDFALNPVRDESGKIIFLVPSGNVITERKRAETAMRESNEKFHQLADNISDAFWIRSPDMSAVQYVSPAFEKIWGRTAASLHANPHEWSRFIFAEDRARVVAAFAALTGTGPSLDIEYRIVRPDGGIRWVRVRGFQVRNAEDRLIRHIGIVTDITERKQAETARRESEERFRSYFELGLIGMAITSPTKGFLEVNDELCRILGYGREELLAKEWAELTLRDDLVAENERFGRILAGEIDGYTIEKRFRRKDGGIVHAMIAVKAARRVDGTIDHVVGLLEDITVRKQAEEALRASERRFKALFEQAAVGVAQSDVVTGQIVHVNQRFADMLGRTRPELERLTVAAITHPQDAVRDSEFMRQLRAGLIREYAREKRYRRKDGSTVWVSLTVSAMWAPGEPPGLCIGVVQDITERRRLDEHFLQAQKMEALGQFSGGVAHDFNNILATISGYTELSRMILKENPDVRAHLDAVLRASARAAELVKQILTFSRQEPLERHTIQLRPVVEESVKLLRATIPSTVVFDTDIAADAPTVLANANQIHQVLMNLGVNAWHAMKDRPGRLKIVLKKWVVDDALAVAQPRLRPGRYARVSVSDTGCGMDAATRRRIFEPFFTTKPPGQGTGLGLSVVHGIMDGHDGAVTVTSQPGEGTVFQLYFPAHTGETNVGAIDEGPTPRGRGEAVLVVDDEEMIASMIQQTLNRLDYAAEFATDAETVLALVRADPARYQLVLSDQTMPGMTGLVLATRLREIRPDLPVLLMTGFSASLTPDRIATAGVRQVLFKPLSVHQLGSAMHTALVAQRPNQGGCSNL